MTSYSARILLALALLCGATAAVQGQSLPDYQFLAPKPGALYVPSETGIVIRPGGILQSSSEEIARHITVAGGESGVHAGTVTIALDNRTIVFTPDRPFLPGESVTVRIAEGIRTGDRTVPFSDTQYGFRISSDPKRRSVYSLDRIADESLPESGAVGIKGKEDVEVEKSGRSFDGGVSVEGAGAGTEPNLPSDFPKYDITVHDNPADGYLFFAPFSWSSSTIAPRTPYLLILDNDGNPVFFRRLKSPCFDFKVQPNGNLTYFDNDPLAQVYFELDSTYTKVDSWRMGNGYGTDLHGLQLLPNGHALLMSYDLQTVDMSKHVPGGKTDAGVVGFVIQEQDAGHNVIFEWRSWDHFLFTDAADNIDLTAGYIDYVHGNAIELDRDGNLMISSRHMDEITKINRQTGKIMWRWGGENNQFTFVNDTLQFTHQHDIRRLPNGNITLFDNGNRHSPQRSRGVEYQLDEQNKTATLVWEYPEGSEQFSVAMGNTQRLPDGNTVIGWGYPTQGGRKQAVTEVRPDGSVAFELLTDTNVVTYRAFRFPWSATSAAPYLWTEDADNTMADTLTVNLTMFGRDDIVEYTVVMSDATWPPPSEVVAVTAGNSAVVRGLERGKNYRLEAYGKTASGEETERSEQLLFNTLPVGPVLQAASATLETGSTGIAVPAEVSFPALVSNIGEEPMEISGIDLEGDDANAFEVIAGGDVPAILAPGAARDITLRFTPSHEGLEQTTLVIRSNAVNDTALRLNVRGTGVSTTVGGVDVDFGRIVAESVKDTVVSGILCNTGEAALVITSLEIDEPAFILLSALPLPLELAPGECLNLSLRFAPTEKRSYTGTLRIQSSGKPNPLEIALKGGVRTPGSVAVEAGGAVRALSLSPNPAVNEVRIDVTLAERAVTEIEITDSRGRLLRAYKLGSLEAGRHSLRWDGCSGSGRPVPNGSYFVRVSAGNQHLSLPVTLAR